MIDICRNKDIWKKIFIGIIVSLSISPSFATSDLDNRNFLLIGCMCLGPIIFLYLRKVIWKIDKYIIILIGMIFITQTIFNFTSIRITSILFSIMFFIYYLIAIRTALIAQINYSNMCMITKYLIYAYFIVLLIQQFCVLLGLPVFNQLNALENPWKLNSLSAEPSHTSRYVGILMYSFLVFQDKIKKYRINFRDSYKENKKIWISFFWIMFTTVSGTAFIVVVLILSRYLTHKNIVIAVGLLFIVFTIGVSSDITALRRATLFLSAVATGNAEAMIGADHSASVRIVPWMLCIQRINPFSLNGWIGEGGGSTAAWLYQYMPGVREGFIGGGMAAYTLEYGLLVGLLFLYFSLRCCYDKKYKISTIGLWIMCVVLIGVNSQIGWLCILMLYLDKNLYVTNANKSILRLA